MIISLHTFVGTQRARGTVVSPLETDNEQSHMQRVGAAAQIHTHTQIINHMATEQENTGQLQKEEEMLDMRI
jgi:hypothetical protein